MGISKRKNKKEKLESSMYHLIENLRQIAILIKPFMNETSENILRQIGIENENLKLGKAFKQLQKLKRNKSN